MAWHERAVGKVYTAPEIELKLAENLPRWELLDGFLCRNYRTAGWKGTLMVVNAVGHLAEVAWHHPELQVTYAAVAVKLQTHIANGITDRDLELARKIEEVLMWQPAARPDSALEGTPDDPRFRYFIYD